MAASNGEVEFTGFRPLNSHATFKGLLWPRITNYKDTRARIDLKDALIYLFLIFHFFTRVARVVTHCVYFCFVPTLWPTQGLSAPWSKSRAIKSALFSSFEMYPAAWL